MLSLAHIGRGAEDYHLKAVGHGATLYYSEKGEVAGAWIGKGAADLGLRGKVEDNPLLAVLAGYEPSAQRVATEGQEVWEAGRRLVRGPGNRARLPGIDATFKAPKSVSLLWALGHDIEAGQGRGSVSDIVTRAHDEAVRAAFAMLEEQAAWGRRGHGGQEQVRMKGFVAASFRHRTSRAEDPHLHTHVLVTNMAHKEDGSWGALDGRLLYAWAKTCGYLYESELRARLSRELGVEWTPVRNGIAEVEGVERSVIDRFSKRRHELLGATQAVTDRINRERLKLGLPRIESDSERARDIASHETRARKLLGLATDELRVRWREEAAAVGYDRQTILAQLERIAPEQRGAVPETPDALVARARSLTEVVSTFGLRDALQAASASRSEGMTVRETRLLTAAMLESPEVVPLAGVAGLRRQDVIVMRDGTASAIPTDSHRYSTREMLRIEQALVDDAVERVEREQGVEATRGALDDAIRAATRRQGLGQDQAAMAIEVCLSRRSVQVVNAPPGSGKTTAARVVVEALERSGVTVVGTSLSARARDELRDSASLRDVRTLAMLRYDLEMRGQRLPEGSMLIIDEAGMVDTRTLAWVLARARTERVSVLLIGDHRQLPEVDAGGGFRGLWQRLDGIALRGNRRQEAEWERAAVEAFREGGIRTALALYEAHGRVAYGDPAEMLTECVLAWRQACLRREHVVMESEIWADVDRLNALAHQVRVEAGEAEAEGIDYFGQPVSAGDVVRLQRGDERGLGVINGTEGTVVAIDKEATSITIREVRTGREIVVPRGFLYDSDEPGPTLRLAYCRTSYGVQGGTWSDAAYVFARPEHASAESLLVDLTRGRRANYMFFADKRIDPENHLPTHDERPSHELLQGAMRRETAKTMALDLVASARDAESDGRTPPPSGIDWGSSPATEAQLAWIADLGRSAVAASRTLTWAEASLVIDGTGEAARLWLLGQGASEAEAADVVNAARRFLNGVEVAEQLPRAGDRVAGALHGLLERLEAEAARSGRELSRGLARMLDATRGWRDDLPDEQVADRGPELLERRLDQLGGVRRSRTQENERKRLLDRRALLLMAQTPELPIHYSAAPARGPVPEPVSHRRGR